jgi:hypothetical protein
MKAIITRKKSVLERDGIVMLKNFLTTLAPSMSADS